MVELIQLPGGNLQNTCKVLVALTKKGRQTRKTLETMTGLDKTQVRDAIAALIKAGKVSTVPKLEVYPNVRSTSNSRDLPDHFEVVPDWTPKKQASGGGKKPKTPGGRRYVRDQSVAKGVVAHKFLSTIRRREEKVRVLTRVLSFTPISKNLTDRDRDILHAIIGDYGRE